MGSRYTVSNWYWIVGDTNPATEVYSSKSASFVATSDAGYVAFLAANLLPTKIDTQAELIWVFSNAGFEAGAAGLSATSAATS